MSQWIKVNTAEQTMGNCEKFVMNSDRTIQNKVKSLVIVIHVCVLS